MKARRTLALSCLAIGVAAISLGGQKLPGRALPDLIRANERFGRMLLERMHETAPNRNVVVSPISISMILAALQSSSEAGQVRKEIGKVFGWGDYPDIDVPARMLLVAFEPPAPERKLPPNVIRGQPVSLPEGAWISNAVLFGGTGRLSDRFTSTGEKYFGMTFTSTGVARPSAADIRRARPAAGALPQTSPLNDFSISSSTHLGTEWSGNTFKLGTQDEGEFVTGTGERKRVTMMTTELAGYRYASTDAFEAVALPGNRAYLLVVLPPPGKSILELERDLIASPDLVDAALVRRDGRASMPTFEIQRDEKLRPPLEALGILEPFKNLGSIVTTPGSHLTEINQTINLQVDRAGIRADAETIASGIYGGITGVRDPFRMTIDRPFLFFVRDTRTDTLLFLGAVMDPGAN